MKPALALMAAALAAAAAQPLVPVNEAGFQKLLQAHRGKVVLVDFWATWCDPCREELPMLAALEHKLRARGLVLLTVSADEPEQAASALDLLRKNGLPLPGYIRQADNDEAFINSIDPKWSGALPALFLYDRQGRKARVFIGETGRAEIEAAVSKLL